jgi:hypothetical protein
MQVQVDGKYGIDTQSIDCWCSGVGEQPVYTPNHSVWARCAEPTTHGAHRWIDNQLDPDKKPFTTDCFCPGVRPEKIREEMLGIKNLVQLTVIEFDSDSYLTIDELYSSGRLSTIVEGLATDQEVDITITVKMVPGHNPMYHYYIKATL